MKSHAPPHFRLQGSWSGSEPASPSGDPAHGRGFYHFKFSAVHSRLRNFLEASEDAGLPIAKIRGS